MMNGNLTTTFEPSNLCPSQRAITRPLLFVHNYSVFIFGSILNLLAFFVLIQNSLRYHSTFAYLAFLSLSNGILSFFRFLQWFLAFYFKFQMESHLSTCRFSRFLLDSLTHFSLFTLVCVNIDRARTVNRNRPNPKFSKSTFHQVFIRELIIAFILCAYHFHWLIKYGYTISSSLVDQQQIICHADPNRTPFYFYFLHTIYPRFEFLTFFCVPLLINTSCTIIIVRSLCMRMRTVQRFNLFNKNSLTTGRRCQERLQEIFSCCLPRTDHFKSNMYSCLCFRIHCRHHRQIRLKFARTNEDSIKYEEENSSIDRRPSLLTNCLSQDSQQISAIILNKIQRTRRIRDIHLSAMLIVLNIVYFIFNLPFNLHQTFAYFWYPNRTDECVMRFNQLLVDTIQQTYFSTNFFLYVLTNRRFREEFYNTMMRLFTRREEYLLRRSLRQRRAGSLSINPSTGMIVNFNGEYQTMPSNNPAKRLSLISEIELNEQQKTTLVLDENQQLISKIVRSDQLPYEHLE